MKAQDARTGRFVQVETTLDRFMSQVSPCPNTGCWFWAGAVNRYGYGKFQLDGETRSAHSVSYELHVGPVPAGKLLRHSCDLPPCVNPAHALPGTQSDNIVDAVRRGRWPRAKLDAAKVREIRRRRAAGEAATALASEFEVSVPTISNIAARRVWGWIDEVPTGAAGAGEG